MAIVVTVSYRDQAGIVIWTKLVSWTLPPHGETNPAIGKYVPILKGSYNYTLHIFQSVI